MWRWTFAYLCGVMTVSQISGEVSRVVTLAQGSVRGYRDPEGEVFAFYGIPYATGPTGPNRFKSPLPPPSNEKTLEAIDKGVICPQASMGPVLMVNKTAQEDCLIANIFVPDTDNKDLPVYVNVHGGAFQVGLGNWFLYNNLIRTKKMIVVTFNYRLGVHGFLCLGTKDAPGNAGMKDQVALLRWVKNNIQAFGGNPNDVSLGGGSAGGASVDLLMLSKAAKGLFNKVIPESGSSLAAFSIQPDPLENAKKFAQQLGFTNIDDIYALEDFYKTATLQQLTSDAFYDRTDNTFVFSPCVEREDHDEVFLDEDPVNIIKSGKYEKLPLLIGFASMEGLLRIEFFDIWKKKMNEKFYDFLPADLKFKNHEQKQEVANAIKQFYFGDKSVDTGTVLSYVDYFSDALFTIPALRSIELHLKNGHDKIYLYEYSFTDEDVPPIPHTQVRGANHCSQSMTIMDGNMFIKNENSESKEYKKLRSELREMWSNFITFGQPVPDGSSLPPWPAVSENSSPYMSLGETLELKQDLMGPRLRFWNKIYDKYYHTPLSPPTPPEVKTEL